MDGCPDFRLAFKDLGSKGNLVHYGFGSQYEPESLPTVLNIIKGPDFKKLKSLTIYEPFGNSTAKVVCTRKDTLKELRILSNLEPRRQFSTKFLAQLSNLVVLEINQVFKGLSVLAKLHKLRHLKLGQIGDTVPNYTLPPKCLPELTFLELGSIGRFQRKYRYLQGKARTNIPNEVCFPLLRFFLCLYMLTL